MLPKVLLTNSLGMGVVDGSMEAAGDFKNSHILHYNENLGSRGGFAAGMVYGLIKGYRFFWQFNDDSRAQPDAFRYNKNNVE